MGKGTKHASDWKETTLQVILDAKRLYTHSVKTLIRKATSGITFLGYTFKVAENGKVLMFRDRKRVKEIRRRMIRLAHKIRRGECRRDALANSYQCVRACLEHGNSNRILRNMDSFYKQLGRSI